MLIDWLRKDPIISKYICNDCSENGVEVILDNKIDPSNLLIIKIDGFYNREVNNPPRSPDCLIIQRCDDHFDIYVIELRNISGPDGFSIKEIEEKFTTCLDDFMSHRFGNYFHHSDVEINVLKLYLISDPYDFKNHPNKQLYMRGHKFDLLSAIRIPRFFNKHLYIEPHIPNPMILLCA